MKLSNIKGERAIEVIADIVEPVISIAGDKEALELFRGPQTAETLSKNIPALLRSHKREVIAIFAAIEGVPADEYAAETDVIKLLKSLTELVTDEVFLELFTSAQPDVKQSGPAPVSSGE